MSILSSARRIARHRAATPAELREENKLLLAREVAGGDFFTILIADRDEVHALWQHAEGKAADAELVVVCQQAEIKALADRVVALEARLANADAITVPPSIRDTAAMEDQATEPIDVRSIQARFAVGPVVTLANSPQAAHPAHVPAVVA